MIDPLLRGAGGATPQETLRRLLPPGIGVGVHRDGYLEPADLFPEERRLLGPRATDGRRRQFALGRAAAHAALVDLGLEAVAVGRGSRGEPLWPGGFVGAIAHTGRVGVAVVGRARDYWGLGVDVETGYREVSDAAARLVCTAAEQAWVDLGASDAERNLRRLSVFCAKECVFKALYPVEAVYLGFSDAELTWRDDPPGFVAELGKAAGRELPAGKRLEVRCALAEDVLLAALAVPRASATSGAR